MSALVGAYFLSWTAAYIFVTYQAVKQLDFSYYIDWFVRFWTNRGLDMVVFTGLFTVVLFIPLGIISAFLVKRLGRR